MGKTFRMADRYVFVLVLLSRGPQFEQSAVLCYGTSAEGRGVEGAKEYSSARIRSLRNWQ